MYRMGLALVYMLCSIGLVSRASPWFLRGKKGREWKGREHTYRNSMSWPGL